MLLVSACLMASCGSPAPSPTPPDMGGLQITITDAAGKPLSGAKIVSDTQPEGQLKVTGITGDKGITVFNRLKPGTYRFNISRFDYQGLIMEINVVAGQTNISANLSSLSPIP